MALFKALLVTTMLLQGISSFPSIEPLPNLLKNLDEPTDPKYRLPEVTAKNLEYTITLTPYMEPGLKQFTFDGEMLLKFTVEETNVIDHLVMHANNLNITFAEFKSFSPATIDTDFIDSKYQFVRFISNKKFNKGVVYTLRVVYSGKLQNNMKGFYLSNYKEDGNTEYLGTTQFQQIHARQAFPCFDEPQYKANFEIVFNCPVSYNCVSNMMEESRNGYLVKFAKSPKMSTYLVAFIVSKFEKAEKTDDKASKQFSIFARPKASDQGKYSFETGMKIVDKMSEYTGIDYYTMGENGGQMKMDQAAIPDFSAGAMENWGLLTYREAYLMIDEQESSTKHKQKAAGILAHEIAHMWFGDLVTCHWWSDTWLNEGFARYFQYFLTHMVEPSFALDDYFIVEALHTALLDDGSASSDALTQEVNSPEEVGERFKTISYSKGASVIRMMEHWLGSETFQKGLQKHLTSKKYGVVKPENLYESLQSAADEDKTDLNEFTVEEVMSTWVSQSGYPILEVAMDHETGNITLKQKRFVKDEEKEDKKQTLYKIPITYTTASENDFNNTKPKLIMENETIEVSGDSEHGWAIFNIQQSGYYRVLYDDDLYKLIIKVLSGNDTNSIHKYNRAQIVNDAFSFAREDYFDYSKMLDIIQFLENDVDLAPWQSAYNGISYLRNRFLNYEDLSTKFDDHILKLMKEVIIDVGFDSKPGESDSRKTLRTSTMTLACSLGHKECIDTSLDLFKNMTENKIDPDMREFVYCNALRYGNATDFDQLWMKHETDNVVNEKLIILGALGCTKDQAKVEEYLGNIIDPEISGIRSQDTMAAFNSALTGNKENVETTYKFVMNETAKIKENFDDGTLLSMFSNIASRMSEEQLKMFENDLEKNSELSVEEKSNAKKSIDNARKVNKWTEKIQPNILGWIKTKYNSAASASISIVLMSTMITLLYTLK